MDAEEAAYWDVVVERNDALGRIANFTAFAPEAIEILDDLAKSHRFQAECSGMDYANVMHVIEGLKKAIGQG